MNTFNPSPSNTPPKGSLLLLLHAHLPFVRHPEEEDFLEEDWLFEAITETYLPLLGVLRGLRDDQVPAKMAMTITPTLAAMLADPLLIKRYERHLDGLIELAEREMERTAADSALHMVAELYQWRLTTARRDYCQRYDRDLISAFVDFARTGHLELVACAATHGFLPALAVEPAAVNAQVAVGVDRFTKTFGYPPAGIWAPECGYFGAQEQGIYPGLESVFARHGLKYFFTDAHGVLHGTPRPAKGVYAPVMTDSGVAVFGRDVDAARQVWSAKTGYPGDPVYRDFYRDIGFDLPLDYIGPWVQPTGDRKMTGFKYHQITGQSESKKVYNPAEAAHRVAEHAADFVERRIEQIGRIAPLIGDEPVIVAPYDAELFGHWWFEGPDFLNSVFRIVAMRSDQIRTVTPSQVLAQQKGRMQVIAPATSSWGEGGHAGFWINETNHWIYPPIHRATVLLQTVINENREGDALLIRTLKQMARELLLAESSDWAFIIKTGDMAPYAKARVAEHIDRFNQFAHMIQDGEIDQEYLAHAESRTPLFPHIDLDWFVISDPAL